MGTAPQPTPLVTLTKQKVSFSSLTSGNPFYPLRPRSNPAPTSSGLHSHESFFISHDILALGMAHVVPPHPSCRPLLPINTCKSNSPSERLVSIDPMGPADTRPVTGSLHPLLPFPDGVSVFILNIRNPSLLPSVLLRRCFGHQLRLFAEFSVWYKKSDVHSSSTWLSTCPLPGSDRSG